MRSMIRAVMLEGSAGLSSRSFSSGNSGVRSSNRGRWRACSGSPSLTVSMRSSAGFFSLRAGDAGQPGDVVALAQPVLAGLLHRHVDVVAARQVAVDPQEAVALVAEVEVAGHLDGLADVLGPDTRRASGVARLTAVSPGGRAPWGPSSSAAALAPAPAAPAAAALAVLRRRSSAAVAARRCPRRRLTRPRRPRCSTSASASASTSASMVVGSRSAERARRVGPRSRPTSAGRSPRSGSGVGRARRCRSGAARSPSSASGSPARRADPAPSGPPAGAVARAAVPLPLRRPEPSAGPGPGLLEDVVDDVALLGPGRGLQRRGRTAMASSCSRSLPSSTERSEPRWTPRS